MNLFLAFVLVISLVIYDSSPAPQEITLSQLETTTKQETASTPPPNITTTTEAINTANIQIIARRSAVTEENCITRAYAIITTPIVKFIAQPKVHSVLRNIGTCVVNGAMEIVSYYLPAPFIPLIATAAGMIIPFEPVVTLREKMPVASYRRAFQKAVNGFLGTFDKYKLEDGDEDPYMTRRFNRRIRDISKEIENKSV